MTFKEYKGLDLVGVGNDILERWKRNSAFEKSLSLREGAPEFIFFEGPPSANGMPGIHHVMARSIKDAVCRYKTQTGYLVRRRAGWDTHGLPVELGVEKKLGITKEDIGTKISVAEYNDTCRREVMKYTAEWRNLTERIGYWVDMDDPYVTYDNRYIETLWYLLKDIYGKGYLYKGKSIQPYSPAAGTGLSSHELNQPGCYRDVKDTTVCAQFKCLDEEGLYFLAWTTTPWTLPSNTALCVGPNIDYVRVRSTNPYTGQPATYILAKELVGAWFNDKVPYEVLPGTVKGTELAGMRYEQLIPWFRPDEGAFRVILGDYVTTEDGTGIVHIAPTFGADDAKVARIAGVPGLYVTDKDGLPQAQVDPRGRFYRIEDLDPAYVADRVSAEYGEWAGRYVKNAYDESLPADAPTLDIDLCVMLKAANKAFRIEKHTHNYPHCWRTDKPVLYYPLNSWFIKATAVREQMMALNEQIPWKPEATGTGRFGKWLENIQDWNLSRSRYWGTPLPIWRTDDGKEEICIGSAAELYAEIEKAVAAGIMASNPLKEKGFDPADMSKENYDRIDLHRPYVDEIFLVSPSGKKMTRETDLIDVWFDSGSMPYAQTGLRGKDTPDFGITADFIAEGVDQTRGWFYTLHAIHTMVSGTPAFKRVISNGLVLDKKGEKMSKRLGNAVDPFQAMDTYGPDPLRWYMLTNAQPWDNLKFDEAGVDEVRRKFFGTLYNTYSFFALYANVDGFDPKTPAVPYADRPEIDRWIISLLNSLIRDVRAAYEDYDITLAGRLIQDFVCDHLSNWYVRLNRKRFWGGEPGPDKTAAYQTLYEALRDVAVLSAVLYGPPLPGPCAGRRGIGPLCRDARLRRLPGRHRPGGADGPRAEGHLDGARTPAQGRHQGAPAPLQARHPRHLRQGTRAAGAGEGHPPGRSQRQGSRVHRRYHRHHHQEDQAQLQDPGQDLRQADEGDRRRLRAALPGGDRRHRARGGRLRPRAPVRRRHAPQGGLRDPLRGYAGLARGFRRCPDRGAGHHPDPRAAPRRRCARADPPDPEPPQGERVRGHRPDQHRHLRRRRRRRGHRRGALRACRLRRRPDPVRLAGAAAPLRSPAGSRAG